MDELDFLKTISSLSGWGEQKPVMVGGDTWDAYVHPATKRLVIVGSTGLDYPTLHARYILKCKHCGKPVLSQKLYTAREFQGYRACEPDFSSHTVISIKMHKIRRALRKLKRNNL